MNNICSTIYFIFELYISQHCELYLCVSQGQQTMLNKWPYRDMPAHNKQQTDGSAASSGHMWANSFLAGRSKDKWNSLHLNIFFFNTEYFIDQFATNQMCHTLFSQSVFHIIPTKNKWLKTNGKSLIWCLYKLQTTNTTISYFFLAVFKFCSFR